MLGCFWTTCRRFSPVRHPFKVLGISSTATKAQVKSAYRQLAKQYHPDATGGDSKKMEEINQAYKWLMKEGGFEQLRDGRGTKKKKTTVHPFAAENEEQQASRSPISEEEMEKWGALDPSSERRTPTGKFLYQSRDDQSWVELDRPLLRANQPRYGSFAAQSSVVEELRKRQMTQEKEQNEKTAFQRNMDKLANSADLPSRNPYFLRLYVVMLVVLAYFMIVRTFARQHHQNRRRRFYRSVEEEREELLTLYYEQPEMVDELAVAAAILCLIAARKKDPDSTPLIAPPPLIFDTVRAPPEHFQVVAST